MLQQFQPTVLLLALLSGCDQSTIPQAPQNAPIPTDLTVKTLEDISTADDATESQTERFKVIGIIDGDTFDVLTHDKHTIRLRLNGIDCAERGQPFGNNAKDYLSQTIGGKMVRLNKV